MVSHQVIFCASPKSRFDRAMLRGPHFAMVDANAFSKGSGLPPLHSRGSHGDVVDATPRQRHIPADVFKALFPKQLAAAPNVLDVREPIVVLKRSLTEGRSDYSESRILGKFGDKIGKVTVSKGDVGIEIANHFIFAVSHSGEAGVESPNFPSEVPFQGFSAAYLATISSVPSVEPSLTITHFAGRAVCATTELRVCSINAASFRAGVMRMYVGNVVMPSDA